MVIFRLGARDVYAARSKSSLPMGPTVTAWGMARDWPRMGLTV